MNTYKLLLPVGLILITLTACGKSSVSEDQNSVGAEELIELDLVVPEHEMIDEDYEITYEDSGDVDTSDWKTYSQEDLGVEFKYPPSAIIRYSDSRTLPDVVDGYEVINISLNELGDIDSQEIINIYPAGGDDGEYPTFEKEEETNIGGIVAIQKYVLTDPLINTEVPLHVSVVDGPQNWTEANRMEFQNIDKKLYEAFVNNLVFRN